MTMVLDAVAGRLIEDRSEHLGAKWVDIILELIVNATESEER